MHQMIPGQNSISMLLERGDYARVEVAAAAMVPGKEAQLHQFRVQMESYERARGEADWYRALRALTDARLAAISAGLVPLEEMANRRLKETIRLYEGRRN